MRAAITLAALCAGSHAAVTTLTVMDITTTTIVVHANGPAPTTSSSSSSSSSSTSSPAASSEAHVQAQTQQVQQQPSVQVQQSPQPAPQSPSKSAPSFDLGSALGDPYKIAVLQSHNAKRAIHGASGLQWDDNLASLAEEQADGCVWGHQTSLGGTIYGQNIAAGMDPTQVGDVIGGLFYDNEEPRFAPYYGNPNPPDFEAWGHFTQVVWKETTHVGCVTKLCPGGLAGIGGGMNPFYTVCNYSPAGNMQGEYAAQVSPPN